ncbi:sugar ABC transporter ATP-binding protein [Salinispira pacifica]
MSSNGPLCEFRNVSKRFFGIAALRDVSLELHQGQLLGLIGENGAGKTTLMNILGGVVQADEGQMAIRGEPYDPRSPRDAIAHGVAFIHQELNLFGNLSVAENLFIDRFPSAGSVVLRKAQMVSRTREILAGLAPEISPTARVSSLSPGEKQMVEIARTLVSDAQIVIFDEPTTSLTSRETERLFRIISRLKEGGRAIIYISHILKDVVALADRIIILRDGRLVANGEVSAFDPAKMISLMVGREIENIYPQKTVAIRDSVALEVDRLSKSGIVADIDLKVRHGEIVGLFGLMGSGRTELARIIFGVDDYDEGEIRVEGEPVPHGRPVDAIKRGVAYVTEDRREEGLMMQQSISENLGLISLRSFITRVARIVKEDDLRGAVKRIAGALRIKSGDIFRQQAKTLSGGNQQKTVIGKWLVRRPTFLILDEPTKGIDVGAKYEVYTIMNDLAQEGTAILFISSELEELVGMCDRIEVLSKGELVGSFTREEFDQETILHAAFRQNLATAPKEVEQ